MAADINKLKATIELLLKSRDLTKEQKKYYDDLYNGLKRNNSEQETFNNLQKDINQKIQDAKDALLEVRGAFAASVDEMKNMNSGLSRTKKAFDGLESIAQKLHEDQKGLTRMTIKQLGEVEKNVKKKLEELKINESLLSNQKDQLKQDKKKLGNSAADLKAKKDIDKKLIQIQSSEEAIGAELNKSTSLNKDLIKYAESRLKEEKAINKSLGATPQILGGIGAAMKKLGLPDFGLEEAIEDSREQLRLEEGKVTAGKAFGAVTKNIGKKLKAQLSIANLMVAGIGFMVDAMMGLDAASGAMAKNLGISYTESLGMQENFNEIALSSDSLSVSSKGLNESFNVLNEGLSGATNFSDEMLESFTKLTKEAKVSTEAAISLQLATGATGVELESQYASLLGQVTVQTTQNKLSLSSKQVLEGISKISKGTLLTLQQQPKQLAAALVTSKKLALSFAQMESISSSLLDFEGSIQSELEAELLTGKNLNLEKARQFALEGNIGAAAEEVAKQVGSAAEFGKMNVLQQEALAKAVGMTKDGLAESLMEKEALAKMGVKDGTALEAYNKLKAEGLSDEQIAVKLGDDKLAKQLKSKSIQEGFAASMERLKEIFIDVAASFMPIVGGIASGIGLLAKFIGKWSGLIKVLGAAWLIMKGMQKTRRLMLAFQNRGLIAHKAANIFNKLGLITDQQKVLAKGRSTLLAKNGNKIEKLSNLYKNQGLATQIRSNAQAKLSNLYEGIKKQFTSEGLAYKTAIFLKDQAINAAQLVNNSLTAIGLGMNKENLILKGLIFVKDQAINV